jgi:hypothetical protein
MGSVSLKYKSKSGNLTAPGDVDPGAMIPITTTTLSTNTASVTFSDIPQNYEHLQLRVMARANVLVSVRNITLQINSDTTNNYYRHYVVGTGASAVAGSDAGTVMFLGNATGTDYSSSAFGVSIYDILDYSNTNKYKTVRCIYGQENNTNGQAAFGSGLWKSTNAINSITFTTEGNYSFMQYSHFALYGIKRAGA